MVRNTPPWLAVVVLLSMGTVMAVAAATGVWLAALLIGFSMLTLAPIVFPRWRIGEHLRVRPNSTRAQQNVIGYAFELPFWAALLIYYRADPVIIAGLVVVTAGTAALVAREMRREGWSRRS